MSLATILKNHYDARGGLEAIMNVQSLHHIGTVTEKSGRVIHFKGWRKRPNFLKVRFTVEGGTGIEGFDGTRAWELFPWKSEKAVYITDVAERALKRGSEFDGHLVNYAEKGHHAELREDVDTFDDQPVHTIRVTLYDGNIKDYHIHRETHLIIADASVRPVHAGEESLTINRYEDYRAVNGVLFSHKWVQTAFDGDHQETFAWESIQSNLDLAPNFFEIPSE